MVWMATGGFCGARARRREREAGADGSSSSVHAGYTRGTRTVCEGGVWIRMRVTPSLYSIVRGWRMRPWSRPMTPHATWVRGVTHGGRGRSQRAVRGSSVAAACVEGIRAVLLWPAVPELYAWPEGCTRVVVGWWDRRCAREGLGKYRHICGFTSTCVVAEAYMWS